MPPHPAEAGGQGLAPCRKAISAAVVVSLALVHVLRAGTRLRGAAFVLYYSYFSDIAAPFGLYFLLCLTDASIPVLRSWRRKAVAVFAVASATEVAQAVGVPLLGRTFDPLDFIMFAAGVTLAAALDAGILTRLAPCWSPPIGREPQERHAGG